MAYKVIILYQLYMPSYFLGTFTEYPCRSVYFAFIACTLYDHTSNKNFKTTKIPN